MTLGRRFSDVYMTLLFVHNSVEVPLVAVGEEEEYLAVYNRLPDIVHPWCLCRAFAHVAFLRPGSDSGTIGDHHGASRICGLGTEIVNGLCWRAAG